MARGLVPAGPVLGEPVEPCACDELGDGGEGADEQAQGHACPEGNGGESGHWLPPMREGASASRSGRLAVRDLVAHRYVGGVTLGLRAF
jgi:hypothetical protein